MSTTSPPTAGTATPKSLSGTLLSHTPATTYAFTFTPFLQRTHQHSLPSSRPICKSYASGSCPLKSHCPDRHPSSTHPTTSTSSFGSLVCKHWLRGLCKKGESCEFLHEYNLRKMPECNFFVRNGYCSNGDECLYLHIDPSSRLPPCPHYERGFCPLGPRCDKKHVRRKLCVYYLAGFCPEGKGCKEGAHPRWTKDGEMEKPRVREEKKEDEAEREREREEREREGRRERERERERDRGEERGHGHKDGFGRGRGRWRGKGRFRGRGH
ncbi:hypothetical protein OQA88_3652 [Cercophora sp. LCS_1]